MTALKERMSACNTRRDQGQDGPDRVFRDRPWSSAANYPVPGHRAPLNIQVAPARASISIARSSSPWVCSLCSRIAEWDGSSRPGSCGTESSISPSAVCNFATDRSGTHALRAGSLVAMGCCFAGLGKAVADSHPKDARTNFPANRKLHPSRKGFSMLFPFSFIAIMLPILMKRQFIYRTCSLIVAAGHIALGAAAVDRGRVKSSGSVLQSPVYSTRRLYTCRV
jgi:hypothetical protein